MPGSDYNGNKEDKYTASPKLLPREAHPGAEGEHVGALTFVTSDIPLYLVRSGLWERYGPTSSGCEKWGKVERVVVSEAQRGQQETWEACVRLCKGV